MGLIDTHLNINFFLRLYISLALYTYISMGIAWLDTSSNTILAIFSKLFVFFIPWMIHLKNLRAGLFMIGSLGCTLIYFNHDLIGSILLAFSIALISFLLKVDLTKTHHGSISNVLAINYGTIISGIFLYFITDRNIFSLAFAFIFITISCYEYIKHKRIDSHPIKKNTPSLRKPSRKTLSWLFIGMTSGLNIYALFAFLSDYLFNYYGELPSWYGLMVALNSIIIVCIQTKMYQYLIHKSIYASLLFLAFGIGVMVCPNFFHAEYLIGSMLWVIVFSIFECTNACLDYYSAQEKKLFSKDIGVGLGMGLAVILGRSMLSQETIAIVIFGIYLIGVLLYQKKGSTPFP